MRRVQNHNLAELLMQLRYTPEGKRQGQVNAAEALLDIIDPDKSYPFDFIHFRITGFAPKHPVEDTLLPGRELLVDLQAFIAKLSSKSPVPSELLDEKVYSLEELATELGVSTKTITRWRKQGLVARKFVFADGARRLGFRQSSVDHFVQKHPDRVSRASQFNRLTVDQQEEIIEKIRIVTANEPTLSRHQVIQQVASQTGRAHETIRYTLQEYEKAHPKESLFDRPLGILNTSQATHLYEQYLAGIPIPELMETFNRSRSSIYRIINQRRAAALLARKIVFVASDEFEDPDIRTKILAVSIDSPNADPHELTEPYQLHGEQILPDYLQILKDTPVLSTDHEWKLFRKYNCLKYLAAQTRKHLNLSLVSSAILREIENYLNEAEAIERIIVEANLRLVVSIASKHSPTAASFAELVSKGNYALIQAVQEFDYTTGFRFAKRASLSIAKEYAKVSGKDTELTKTRAASIASRQLQLRQTVDIAAIERTRQSLTEVIHQELEEREEYIILHHFGLTGTGIRRETQTLKEIGDHLQITKERVRQIELIALQKLRQCLSSEAFELLTG